MLILVSGLSGVGKDTVIEELKKNFPLKHFQTATTRESNRAKPQYKFVSEEEFDKLLENGELFEEENIHGFRYSILNSELEKVLNNASDIFIRDIDVHGVQKLKKHFGDKVDILTVFIDAPDEELHKRLSLRGESDERIKVRLSRGNEERKFKNTYDVQLDNINLDETVAVLTEIINDFIKQNSKKSAKKR